MEVIIEQIVGKGGSDATLYKGDKQHLGGGACSDCEVTAQRIQYQAASSERDAPASRSRKLTGPC